MKGLVTLLATVLAVQPLLAQLAEDSSSSDPTANGLLAPVYAFTNGPGQIRIYEQGHVVDAGELLPIGSKCHLVAVPGPGYQFVNWNPVTVFTLTEVTSGAEGSPGETNTSVIVSPISKYVDHPKLENEVQPITTLYELPGVRTITEGQGWQANFEPVSSPGRRFLEERTASR